MHQYNQLFILMHVKHIIP